MVTIKGNIYRNVYGFYNWEWDEPPYHHTDTQFVKEEVLWEGELDIPVMKSGDRLHILELDLTVIIGECLRTTDNKFIYSTHHTIEIIEDEITEKSRLGAIEREVKYLKELEDRKLEKKIESDQPWYKKMFNK